MIRVYNFESTAYHLCSIIAPSLFKGLAKLEMKMHEKKFVSSRTNCKKDNFNRI